LVKRVRMKDGSIFKKRYFVMPDKVHAQAVLNILENSDLSKKEKFIVHRKAAKILGKKHRQDRCQYCFELRKYRSLIEEDSELNKREMAYRKAQALLKSVAAEEDFEGNSPGADTVESEARRTANRRPEFDSNMSDFEGPEASEGEFDDDELVDPEEYEGEISPWVYEDEEGNVYEPEEVEDMEGEGLPNVPYEGDEGYSDGDLPEEMRTHIFDTGAYRNEKARPLDSEDQEGYYEDEEGDSGCPYCGQTIQMALASGSMMKRDGGGVVHCPGCETGYEITKRTHIKVSPEGGVESDGMVEELMEEIGKRDNIIGRLTDRLEESLMNKRADGTHRPKLRKGFRKVRRNELEDEEINKADSSLEADKQKAIALQKSARESGKPLSQEDKAFCETTLDRSMDKKVSG